MPNKTKPPITRDPETHSGAPVFTGTRIPVKVLFDYLADGQSVDAFVKHLPVGVTGPGCRGARGGRTAPRGHRVGRVRIVIDEDIPRELVALFGGPGLDVRHVEDIGFKGMKNGALLTALSSYVRCLRDRRHEPRGTNRTWRRMTSRSSSSARSGL